MKNLFVLCCTLLSPAVLTQTYATNVGLGTIEQPINLVTKSDPASIPLGAVIYESNYNYGVHPVISAARPCRHGAMVWKGGSELNQNLASVFGIFVEPKDPSNVPYDPVVIRVKAWKKPAYSPYSKEQVLAATLHCLLRSVGASKKHPLRIEVVAEDTEDAAWAKKYTRLYINMDEEYKRLSTPTPVPGTRLETDHFGVTHVVFTKNTTKPKLAKPDVMIASRLGGENESEGTCVMIPVWTGFTKQETKLSAAVLPCGLYYDLFNPGSSLRADANVLPSSDRYFRMGHGAAGNTNEVFLDVGGVTEHDLAAALYGIILTTQPTAEKPLQITLRPTSWEHDKLTTFVTANGWKKEQYGGSAAISCQFIIDPKNGKLTRGSLPQIEIKKTNRGSYWTKDRRAENPDE